MADNPVEKTDKSSTLPQSPELMIAEDSALLVIDAQEKLLEIVPQRARIVWNIRRLLDAAEALHVPIAATEQYPDQLSPTVPELKERIGAAPTSCASALACVTRFSIGGEPISDIEFCSAVLKRMCALCRRRSIWRRPASNRTWRSMRSGARYAIDSRDRIASDGIGWGNFDDYGNRHVRMVPHGGASRVQKD